MKVRDRVDYQGAIKKRLCEANQSVTVFMEFNFFNVNKLTKPDDLHVDGDISVFMTTLQTRPKLHHIPSLCHGFSVKSQ